LKHVNQSRSKLRNLEKIKTANIKVNRS